MATKHEEIIQYLQELPIGHRVSVRSIAKYLQVSEGTAYRAIKSAENEGLVATIARVGTVRIEQQRTRKIDELSFGDILGVIKGKVFGGQDGLKKPLTKFVIGAMQKEDVVPYISEHSLMIVGNRPDIQQLALQHEAAVLITGGFEPERLVANLANEKALPLICTSYDTYTVASLINRELLNKTIKQDVQTVADIYHSLEDITYMYRDEKVSDYLDLHNDVGDSRFPVVTHENRLLGIITYRDVLNANLSVPVEKVMVKTPITVTPETSLATALHLLTSNAIEMLPVTDQNFQLLGVVRRSDFKTREKQLLSTEKPTWTYPTQISECLVDHAPVHGELPLWETMVLPQMVNSMGALSLGTLTELITLAVERTLHDYQHKVNLIDQIDLHYVRLVQLEHRIQIELRSLSANRRLVTFDVDVTSDKKLVAKAIVTSQIIDELDNDN